MNTLAFTASALLLLVVNSARAAGEFEEAMLAYQQGHYAITRAKLIPIAEKGDARAQEILGLMYALGPRVFPGVPRHMRSAALWLDRAARNGRPTARYMYCALARTEFRIQPTGWSCVDRVAEPGELEHQVNSTR
jgi:TPR repeat protein